MVLTLEQLKEAARKLTPDEREILLLELTEEHSPEEQQRIDQAWVEEAERRIRAVETGESQLIDGDQVMAEARAILREPLSS